MADETTKAGKIDVQSVPAMLAATLKVPAPAKPAFPAKAAAPVVKPPVAPAPKPAPAPVAAKVAAKSVEPAKPAPAPAAKVEAKAVPKPTPVAAKAAPSPKPAPVVAKPAPAPVAKPAPVAQAKPAPAAAPAPITPPVTPKAATAAVVQNPPAAVPADIQKESQMATTIENAAKSTTDKAQAIFAETSERTKGAIAKSTKMVEELNAFGKGNVEALVESSKIAAKGFETLGQDAAEFTRKSFEDATAAFKTMSSVKSPTEFMKLQSDFMRSAFDALVAETSRSTESMLKLAGEVAQPISNRMSVAADKMKVAA